MCGAVRFPNPYTRLPRRMDHKPNRVNLNTLFYRIAARRRHRFPHPGGPKPPGDGQGIAERLLLPRALWGRSDRDSRVVLTFFGLIAQLVELRTFNP